MKWVGGKRQLVQTIKSCLPNNHNSYFEPFVGGGAVFFTLNKSGCHINDLNDELINVYKVVQRYPKELIASLQKHSNTSEYYYKIRALDRSPQFDEMPAVDRASRFIFLNKTGFNGLYRVNSKGQHNVSFGGYTNPKILDADNIRECSILLKTTYITQGDFYDIKHEVKEGDFVYLDPPYVPLSKTSSFTSYNPGGFNLSDQERLLDFCNYLDSIGVYFILSNSSSPEVTELYDGYIIKEVYASRSVNCKGDGRGKIKELLIMNYNPELVNNTAISISNHETYDSEDSLTPNSLHTILLSKYFSNSSLDDISLEDIYGAGKDFRKDREAVELVRDIRDN